MEKKRESGWLKMLPLHRNRYIMRLPLQLGIPEWCVRSINKGEYDFDSDVDGNKCLVIKCLAYDIGDYEMIKRCEEFNITNTEPIVYEDLDITGVSLKTEYYLEPHISKIFFEECEYDLGSEITLENVKKFTLVITYDDITDKLEE